jgi:hypothetical protein
MYTRIHCSTVQQKFCPYMYEIEYFCLMTRKFDAASITYVVNYTACIENNILLDVFFLNCNYCAEKSELICQWKLIRVSR